MIPRALWGLPTSKELQIERKRIRQEVARKEREKKQIDALQNERESGIRIRVASKIAI